MLRHLFTWPRDLNNLVDCFWWGTFDLVIWGMTSSYIQEGVYGAGLVSFIIGGLICWTIVSRIQQEIGIEFIKESWDRNMLNIVASPITPFEHFLALILLSLVKLVITIGLMTFLAYLLFSFNIFTYGLLLIPLVFNLLLVGWWASFFINSLIVQYGNRIESFTWILIWTIQPFSGVFYPTSSMPGWMQNIATVIPTSYVFDGMRGVIATGQLDYSKVMWALGLNAVYTLFGILYFRHGYKKALETGMILKLS